MEDLSGLGSQVVDTSDSDDEDGLRFSRNVERTFSSGLSSEVDELLLFGGEFLVVGFSSLGVFSGLGLSLFLSLGNESLSGITELGVSGGLLEVGFRGLGLSSGSTSGSGLGSGGGLSGGGFSGLLVLFDLH